jgi:molybdopterin molybdotransferase
MRPGKPIWAGYHQQTLVIGLPGNPVSSFVGSVLFARPIVDAFLGCFSRRVTPRLAVAGSEFKSKARSDFMVARFDDGSKVVATISSGSADWRSLTATQVLALVPPNSIIAVGDHIEVIPV